ncbi:hypothetical protein LZ198_37720 [Myxococcus sp. K15C18031901]|uniref:hypothetical protein n=1 Tax=Myxococcus dinghuensis TaxID=2906761 RepID=UPI0020A7F0B6|nr:hypothetical protein [Myxococcus dinghuensis]MCP3104618.1 hypothetical protein [Myxococcus dinghuensis]
MRAWLLSLLVLATSCGFHLEAPARTVDVVVPAGMEEDGLHVPVLYLEQERAFFFPEGLGGGARPVEPSARELMALGRRQDIVIIEVGAETSRREEHLPDGRRRYVTHVSP